MTLSNQSHPSKVTFFPTIFQSPESQFKNFCQLGRAGIAIPRKITLGSWFHQILFSD
jgi:hypothetical protein